MPTRKTAVVQRRDAGPVVEFRRTGFGRAGPRRTGSVEWPLHVARHTVTLQVRTLGSRVLQKARRNERTMVKGPPQNVGELIELLEGFDRNLPIRTADAVRGSSEVWEFVHVVTLMPPNNDFVAILHLPRPPA